MSVDLEFAEPSGISPFDQELRQALTEVILWADANASRSQQIDIGPSELGDLCERKLTYRMAGAHPVNTRKDPWPAIVGTAIHEWLEKAVNKYQDVAGAQRWLTELTVTPNPLVTGHSDLYDTWTHTVIDWKTKGEKPMKEFRAHGPSPDHIAQVNLYGLGQIRAGRKVERVALVALPRSGWLAGMAVWSAPYDPRIAEAALARMETVGRKGIELGVQQNPDAFLQVPASPSYLCSFCEWYAPDRVSGIGCPAK